MASTKNSVLEGPSDPRQTLITIRFDGRAGKTTMHLHQTLFSSAAASEIHNGGWSSSFERLEDLVHSLPAKEQA
jgi:hypothetical protein